LIDAAAHHFDGGSWDAAARPLALFLWWAAQRGLAAAHVPSEPPGRGLEPWVRYILERADGKLTTEDLSEPSGVFALAIWDAFLGVLANDDAASTRWLDARWTEHCASLGEPTHLPTTSTQDALVTLLKDAALGISDDLLTRLADAWCHDPLAEHIFNKTPAGETRKRFAVDGDGILRLGGTPWSEVAAHTSPLDVDLDELIATLGAEAASWLVDALKQTPGAALLDLALRGPALRALVGAQLAVRILEPSDGPFPEHAVVSRGDHIRAVRRALADGERPPMGSMRMIPLVRALHTQVPFEARRWAPNPMFASALRRAELWFPDADLPVQTRLLTGLSVRELAVLGQAPLAAADAPILRILRSDGRGESAVLIATLGASPAAFATHRASDGALRSQSLPCDADALRRSFHALPVEPSLAHDATTFLVELREEGEHHVRIPSESDAERLFRFR
jgi:hypothetical protein